MRAEASEDVKMLLDWLQANGFQLGELRSRSAGFDDRPRRSNRYSEWLRVASRSRTWGHGQMKRSVGARRWTARRTSSPSESGNVVSVRSIVVGNSVA